MANVYPNGTHGILGYGVDEASSAPPNSTLLGVYLPYDSPSLSICIALTAISIAPTSRLQTVVSNWAGRPMEPGVDFLPWGAETHLRAWTLTSLQAEK